MYNRDIRNKAKKSSIKLWEIADKLGLHDGHSSRKFRNKLCVEDKNKILITNQRLTEDKEVDVDGTKTRI